MVGLGVSVNVAVSNKLHASFNHSDQVLTEVAELRRYITQQHVATDDALHRILDAIDSRDSSSELPSLLRAQASSNDILQQGMCVWTCWKGCPRDRCSCCSNLQHGGSSE